MRTRILAFVAIGLGGLGLGAGIGLAAAQTGDDPNAGAQTVPMAETRGMDEMHAAMKEQMPSELAERCDELHAAMSRSGMHPMMHGGMGERRHDAHHR